MTFSTMQAPLRKLSSPFCKTVNRFFFSNAANYKEEILNQLPESSNEYTYYTAHCMPAFF